MASPAGIAARFCRGAGAPRVLEHAVVVTLTGEARVQLFERDACRSSGSTARVLDPPRPGSQQRAARRAVRCTRGAPAPRQNRQKIPTPYATLPVTEKTDRLAATATALRPARARYPRRWHHARNSASSRGPECGGPFRPQCSRHPCRCRPGSATGPAGTTGTR